MRVFCTSIAALMCASQAMAGGVDRSGQNTSIIFEDGRYTEFSLGNVSPDVTGTAAGQDSGSVAESFTQIGAGYKWGYGGPVDVAVIFDQPYGADINYGAATTYPLRGSTATLSSDAITVMAKYKLDGGFSLYGGLKSQSIEMEVALPALSYTASGENIREFGYLVGAAYERPDIALRVALTYHSSIDYDIKTTENGAPSLDTPVTTPEAFNLDFQTGIMADTLLFGSIRYVDWTAFEIAPAGYLAAVGSPLVSYSEATTGYSLGIGRKFTDEWSGAITLGYEASGGGFQSNLGPTDGYTSLGLGGTYTSGNMKITGGVQYRMIGDAQTIVSGTPLITSNFDDNSALSFGFKVGFEL